MPRMGKDTFVRIRTPGGAGGYIMAPVLTTTQRDALTGEEGMIIFNSTTDQNEEYDGATWQAVGQVILTTHAALTEAHGSSGNIIGQTTLNTHIADLDAHTRNRIETMRVEAYLDLAIVGATLTGAVVANKLYAVPINISRALTIDRIMILVATESAGHNARVGIYADGTDLYPGALVVDAGLISVNATGHVSVNVSQALTKGLYWMVLVSDGTPTLQRISPVNWSPLGRNPTDFSTCMAHWSVSFSYGVLLEDFPTGGAIASDKGFLICPRLASLN